MYKLLFETPAPILVVAIVLFVAALVVRSLFPDRARWWMFLIGPALAGVILLCDVAVETNTEQLTRLTHEIVDAAEREDASAIISLMSDDFSLDNGLPKSAIENKIRQYLSASVIESNHIGRLEILQADDDTGQVALAVVSVMDPKSQYAVMPMIKSRWEFIFSGDTDGVYRLAKIVTVDIAQQGDVDIWRGHLKF